MTLSKADRAHCDKLGVQSFIQLALILPKKFEDYRLFDQIKEGKEQAVEVTIHQILKTPKTLCP